MVAANPHEGRAAPTHDIITFEVLKHSLASITDEMMLTIQRAGYSPTATQAFDFSVAICDPKGQMLVQGLAVAGHLGSIPTAVEATIRKFGPDTKPGDIFLLNDPYEGGMHLPDMFVIKPVFVDDEIFAYTCAVLHHTDVGGRAPGSMAHDSTEIYQEGLRVPPVRFYEGGRVNRTLTDIIAKNVRIPEKVIGDLRAEVAACTIGERQLTELVQTHGRDRLLYYFGALMDYSERIARSIIMTWPDGVYTFTDYIDDDGLDPDPIRLNVTITIHGDSLTVDYTGTSPQVRGAFNCTPSWTRAWTYASVRAALGVDIPNNDGYCRPVEVIIPEGTILNMRHPAACAARGLTGHRIPDLVFGALTQAIPDRIPAASQGGVSSARFGVYSSEGRAQVFYDNVYGTRGATPRNDGPDGLAELGGNLSNVSVEVEESSFPLRVRRYGLVPDSEGPGKYRGSLAIFREWQILAPQANVTLRSDRRRFPPYGLWGGGAGQPSMTYLNPDTENRVLPSKINMRLVSGDVLFHVAPSGGGWGGQLERDPAAVLGDWLMDKITTRHASETYGVAIDEVGRCVDEAATATLRAALHNEPKTKREG